MQHLLSAFFALVFSIGHAQPQQHTGVYRAPAPFAAQSPVPAPSRQRLATPGCLNDYDCPNSPAPSSATQHIRTSPSVHQAFSALRR